jgi:hypothetical protein
MTSPVAQLLSTQRHSDQSIAPLEDYVRTQVKDKTHDTDANLALLKLYQLYPQATKPDVSILINFLQAMIGRTDIIPSI